ncbi:MAG: hypothetical protein IJH37_02795 [Clostridia bacterium]|nr:hypothetical protein [Clostridia bacterium]
MKKILLVLLTLVVSFSVSSCGKESKEEIKNRAENYTEFIEKNGGVNNIADAKQKLVGKYFYCTGTVSDIYEDYTLISGIKVYLSKDELASVKDGTFVSFVGKIDSVESAEITIEGTTIQTYYKVMKNAYLINNKYTVSGTIEGFYNDIGKHYGDASYGIITAEIEGESKKIGVAIPKGDYGKYPTGTEIKAVGELTPLDSVTKKHTKAEFLMLKPEYMD